MRSAKRLTAALLFAAMSAALCAAPAAAEFGLHDIEVQILDEAEGEFLDQRDAGVHPDVFRLQLKANVKSDPETGEYPDGQPRDLSVELPEGLIGSPFATERCPIADFLSDNVVLEGSLGGTLPDCADTTAIGTVRARGAAGKGEQVTNTVAAYNLVPPPGVAQRLGFWPAGTGRVVIDNVLSESPPYKVIGTAGDVTQAQRFFESELVLWGNPGDPVHDPDRGRCGSSFVVGGFEGDLGDFLGLRCPGGGEEPFLTAPRSCPGDPLGFRVFSTSWQGDFFEEIAQAPATIRCESLAGLDARVRAEPTVSSASSPSGMQIEAQMNDEGLADVGGTAASDIEKAVLTLPRGMTINPSQAEGLATCSEAELARERSDSAFGEGCPGASKIGTVEAESPLLEGVTVKGSLFVAEPYRNRFGSLIAVFIVLKEPRYGISVNLAAEVEPDPDTGRLLSTLEGIPAIPISDFRLRFREGGRSPLITPPRCGTHTAITELTPSGAPGAPVALHSDFEISSGPRGGPCPAAGPAPFAPGFAAGTLNNAAATYSPFFLRLTRRDGDQDITRFSSLLPSGLVGRLAGVGRCPEAQIALAKAKTGRAELRSPSCPADSLIGHTLAGAGAGSQLTYVPGALYLAGPYNGAPLSVVAITAAVAGPFDVGTVVVRQALDLDPVSAEVRVDGAASDPIPHLLAGIPLALRDLRVSVDRPGFTLNPTSCAPKATFATLQGGGSFLEPSAVPTLAQQAARFQAANCARLRFKPRLGLRLRGGTRRGAFPALRAVYRPGAGEQANLRRVSLRFPRSAFVEQGHFRTICTRVQFAASACPKGSIYGRARAFTPLLDEPLEGPVYLRSSNNNLPDAVFALKGIVDVEVAVRIDSNRGALRATVAQAPDVPVSRVVVDMRGGQRGLIVNSADLCKTKGRANARVLGHNSRRATLRPLVRATRCAKRARLSRRYRAR